MTEQGEESQAEKKQPAADTPSTPGSSKGASSDAGARAQVSQGGWIYAKRPVLGFVLLFAVLMGVFYGISAIPAIEGKAIPAYMRFNAVVSKGIINWFGEGARTNGTLISSSRFSVDIQHGCDAIAPTMLFVAAVLAFPASLGSKIPGAVVGSVVLALLNLTRIVALFFTGIYFPRAFEAMHVDVWQPVFILFALTFWVTWAWWATRSVVRQPDVSAATD